MVLEFGEGNIILPTIFFMFFGNEWPLLWKIIMFLNGHAIPEAQVVSVRRNQELSAAI